jgi:hypothetical protein
MTANSSNRILPGYSCDNLLWVNNKNQSVKLHLDLISDTKFVPPFCSHWWPEQEIYAQRNPLILLLSFYRYNNYGQINYFLFFCTTYLNRIQIWGRGASISVRLPTHVFQGIWKTNMIWYKIHVTGGYMETCALLFLTANWWGGNDEGTSNQSQRQKEMRRQERQ